MQCNVILIFKDNLTRSRVIELKELNLKKNRPDFFVVVYPVIKRFLLESSLP